MAYDQTKTPSQFARDSLSRLGGAWPSHVQDQISAAQAQCTRYIAQEPVKATLIALAGGALLTGLVVAKLRGGRG
ncbi:MAG: hypothetical protein EOO29_42185 [Comamonadaceae bacterium]|jgi:hypothetical protein|nr:MAG: hypothetical protein EOO29_42185 [Comamonadaceae bacterium]